MGDDPTGSESPVRCSPDPHPTWVCETARDCGIRRAGMILKSPTTPIAHYRARKLLPVTRRATKIGKYDAKACCCKHKKIEAKGVAGCAEWPTVNE